MRKYTLARAKQLQGLQGAVELRLDSLVVHVDGVAELIGLQNDAVCFRRVSIRRNITRKKRRADHLAGVDHCVNLRVHDIFDAAFVFADGRVREPHAILTVDRHGFNRIRNARTSLARLVRIAVARRFDGNDRRLLVRRVGVDGFGSATCEAEE